MNSPHVTKPRVRSIASESSCVTRPSHVAGLLLRQLRVRMLALAVIVWLAAVTLPVAQGQTFTTLTNFAQSNGAWPYYMSLVQGTGGDLYGTTEWGGVSGCPANECYGLVFAFVPGSSAGTLTTFDMTNGANPYGGLVLGTDGNFYGTTTYGGSTNNGTVFKITPAGTLTTLLNFTSTNGGEPNGVLVQGTDGNFYGTTIDGGASGDGTVFKITPTGTLTTLHSFSGSDGESPYAGLIQGTDGNFYGTTKQGGTNLYSTVKPEIEHRGVQSRLS
jgi:uncharacterized repeat protein (TIGR03803 family)